MSQLKHISSDINYEASYGDNKSNVVTLFEREYVSGLLLRHRGNVSAAAREAQMDRKHLHDLIVKHGLHNVRLALREASPETRRTGT
jgi:DNA-binding NtrC family response regulator